MKILTVRQAKALAARGADPRTGHMKINAMNHVKFVKDDATGSVKYVKVDATGSSRVRNEKRANVWRRQVRRRMRIGAASLTL